MIRPVVLLSSFSLLAACADETPDNTTDGEAIGRSAKVEVCHYTGSTSNPYNVNNVNESAVSSHLAHGDALAGDWWPDADGDGFGDADSDSVECPPTEADVGSYVNNGDDCDDDNFDTNPDAEEVCDDNEDNDCDGQVDEDCSSCTLYDNIGGLPVDGEYDLSESGWLTEYSAAASYWGNHEINFQFSGTSSDGSYLTIDWVNVVEGYYYGDYAYLYAYGYDASTDNYYSDYFWWYLWDDSAGDCIDDAVDWAQGHADVTYDYID